MRSHAGSRLALLLALLALQASPAQAADQDTQLWVYGNTVISLDEGVTATVEMSPRFREGDDQFLTRGTVDFRLDKTVSLGGGLAYVEAGGSHEIRATQQMNLTSGALSFRTRVEERFFETADRPQIRLRQRAQVALPVDERTRFVGAGELLYIARPENRQDDARVDTLRATVSFQRKLSKEFELGLGYMLMYAPREGAEDKISHVPQVHLVWRP